VHAARTVVRLLVLSLLVGSLTLQVAARADSFPVVASGGGPTHGWTAIEWSQTSGAQGVLTVLNSNVGGPGFVSLYLYDATDRGLGGASVGILGNLGDLHYQVNTPPITPAEQTIVTTRSVPYGGQVNVTFDSASLPPGTYKAIFVAGGDGTGWTWALKGNSAVSPPTATTSGSDVFAYSAKDFSGPASAQAYAGGWSVSSMGAAANVHTQRSITASHTLVGIGFLAPGATTAKVEMTMDGPGRVANCYCPLADVTGSGAAGPGTWRFTYTGAGAGTSNLADVLLGAADASLPEP
jgi:hypothetical protein